MVPLPLPCPKSQSAPEAQGTKASLDMEDMVSPLFCHRLLSKASSVPSQRPSPLVARHHPHTVTISPQEQTRRNHRCHPHMICALPACVMVSPGRSTC